MLCQRAVVKFDRARDFELKQNHDMAVENIQNALQALPAGEENARAKIEAALAINLLAQNTFQQALRYGENAARAARILKQENRLDADVLLSLQYLREEVDGSAAMKKGKERPT